MPSLVHTVPVRARLFRTSSNLRDLVGPPDPISHLRPVIYQDSSSPSSPRQYLTHPYSLREFPDPSSSIRDDHLRYKLQRQQTDAYNHAFWSDSNLRFESAKETILQNLPESSTPQQRDLALSEFYKQWLAQESSRLDHYNSQWRKRNWQGIVLAYRMEYRKLKSSIANALTGSSQK